MTIIVLYARISTKDKGHQLPELRRFAQAHDYIVYKKQHVDQCP